MSSQSNTPQITVEAPGDDRVDRLAVTAISSNAFDPFFNPSDNLVSFIDNIDGFSSSSWSSPADLLDVNYFAETPALSATFDDAVAIALPPSPWSPNLAEQFDTLSLQTDTNPYTLPHDSFDAPDKIGTGLGLDVAHTFNTMYDHQPTFAHATPTTPSRPPSRVTLSVSIPSYTPFGSPQPQTIAEAHWQQQHPASPYLSPQLETSLDWSQNDSLLNVYEPDPSSLSPPYGSPNPNPNLNILASRNATLPMEPLQRRNNHVRHTSEIGISWTPNSPSLILTPSEPSSTAPAFLSPQDIPHPDDQIYALNDHASISRRHSVGPDRGRSYVRSPPSSANSSRRSSPYPLGRSSPMPQSPNTTESTQSQFLVVPQPTYPENRIKQRRHSFNGGQIYVRPTEITDTSFEEVKPGYTPNQRFQVASKAGIKASEKRRTKEARFECETCGQSFTTKHNLKNHVAVHLGIKEHVCDACTKPFTTQSVLARHWKTCKAMSKNAHRRQTSDAVVSSVAQ